ncbi:MAG: hypothetical protein ACLT2T_12720 [Bilophila wadsworthia]
MDMPGPKEETNQQRIADKLLTRGTADPDHQPLNWMYGYMLGIVAMPIRDMGI